MTMLFNREYAEGACGRSSVRRGRSEQAKETALELAGTGLSLDKIVRAVKVSLNTVKEWLSEETAPAG